MKLLITEDVVNELVELLKRSDIVNIINLLKRINESEFSDSDYINTLNNLIKKAGVDVFLILLNKVKTKELILLIEKVEEDKLLLFMNSENVNDLLFSINKDVNKTVKVLSNS